jgi:hypothetical protein
LGRRPQAVHGVDGRHDLSTGIFTAARIRSPLRVGVLASRYRSTWPLSLRCTPAHAAPGGSPAGNAIDRGLAPNTDRRGDVTVGGRRAPYSGKTGADGSVRVRRLAKHGGCVDGHNHHGRRHRITAVRGGGRLRRLVSGPDAAGRTHRRQVRRQAVYGLFRLASRVRGRTPRRQHGERSTVGASVARRQTAVCCG